MKKTIQVMALLALATGCGKKEETKAGTDEATSAADRTGDEATTPSADSGGVEIPNIQGLVADVPPGAVPNGTGGAAGFHTEDRSFLFTIMETSPEEAAKDLDTMKADQEVLLKKWVKAEATADGWVLVWESPKLDLSSGEPVEVGTEHSFQVRRTIAGKVYTCYGAVPTAEAAETAVKSCASVRPK